MNCVNQELIHLQPDYFVSTKFLFNKAAIENCIIVFCELSDEKSNLFQYDSDFIRGLISINQQLMAMEYISILFDFSDCLTERIDESCPISALRKIIAISYFLNQLIKQGSSYIDELAHLFHVAYQIFPENNNKDSKISTAAAEAIAICLSVLAAKCKDLNLYTINMEGFFIISSIAVKIIKFDESMTTNVFTQFCVFFLNSLYCYQPTSNINDDVHHLFVDTIKAIISFQPYFQPDFNLLSLCNHLMKFLIKTKNGFPKETRMFVFSSVATLASRSSTIVDFLLDKENIPYFINFVKEIVDHAKVLIKPVKIIRYMDLPKAVIERNELIKQKTFSSKFNYEISDQTQFFEKGAPEFKFTPPYPKNLYYQKLLRACLRFCQQSSQTEKYFESCSKFISAFLHSKGLSLNLNSYLLFWFSQFIADDPLKAMGAFKNINLRYIICLSAYDSDFVPEFSHRIENIILHIAQNCTDIIFLNDIINKFVDDSLSLIISQSFANTLVNCFLLISEEKLIDFVKSISFDHIIVDLLFTLRSYHLIASDEELINNIIKTRTVIFGFLQNLLKCSQVKLYFSESSLFIDALCQSMLEPNLDEFILSLLFEYLVCAKVVSTHFLSVVLFFQSIFNRIEEPGFLDIAHKILNSVVLYFHQNSVEMGSVFLHAKFFMTLVDFVLCTKQKDDLFCMFRILQDCSSLQDSEKEYILDMNPFMRLSPLIESQIMDEELRDRLWSIVCGKESKFIDNICVIKYAAPLSLIFKSFKNSSEALFMFIQFIRKCCESDIPSILEVCNSDIPSYLIELICEYRQKESGDDLFKEAINLLALLSHYSMKTKDLLSLFQSMTLISGSKRPFFTLDLVDLLQQIFDTKKEIPPNFIRNTGRNALFKISETCISSHFSEFTIFFEIKLNNSPWKAKSELVRLVTEKNNTLLLWFKSDQLILTYLNKVIAFEKNIDVRFNKDVWFQAAFVFKEKNLTVFIDAKQVFTLKIPKFVFKEKINSGFFARGLSCCFHSFQFLSTAIDQKTIHYLNLLPKSVATTFDHTEINEFPRFFQPLFKGAISKYAIYIYFALVTHQRTLPNLAQQYPNYPADFYGQPFSFSPQPKYILHCIGGIPTIYPLFAQLDQSYCPELLPSIISVITALVHNCAVNQEEFLFSNSIQVIVCLLSSSKLSNITDDFIEKVCELYRKIDLRPLLRQIFMSLFLDVRLWIYLPVERQHCIYTTFFKLFEESSQESQKQIVIEMSFRYILMKIRVCLWERNTSGQICLFDKPKIDHISKEDEATRPDNLKIIRADFLQLAERVAEISFTSNDAETLCFYALDWRDQELCIEMQNLLIKFIQAKNTTLLHTMKLIFTFKDFFPLFAVANEKIRTNCLHLFMLFCSTPELVDLLQPYTDNLWLIGIVQNIRMKNSTTYFSDVVMSYLFGFYKDHPNEPFWHISNEMIGSDTIAAISMSKVLPLALSSMSLMETKTAKIYASAINRSIITRRTDLTTRKNWDFSFVFFVISRINEDETIDDSSNLILNTLSYLYTEGTRRYQTRITDGLRNLLHFLSVQIKRDIYFVMEIMLNVIMERCLLSGKSRDEVILHFIPTIFEYIFILPDIDAYAPLSIDSENCPKRIYKNVEFQKLYLFAMKGEKFPLNYVYSARIRPTDGKWINEIFAEHLCRLFILYPKMCNNDNLLFILSFTVSWGIQSIETYDTFSQYIRILTRTIPTNGRLNETQTRIFVSYFAGLSKIYLKTDSTHESHIFMMEDAKEFNLNIQEIFKIKVPTEETVEEFDAKYESQNFNFAYSVIEKFAFDCENIYMNQLAIQVSKNATKAYSDFVDKRKTFTRPDETAQMIRRSRHKNITMQLQRYASIIKNDQTKSLKRYVETLRTMSSERGPWCPPEKLFNHHWKLDKSLQMNLRRSLMKENFTFKDHSDAAFLRDSGDKTAINDEIENYQSHLKKLRITDFTGDQTVQILFEDNEIDENELRQQTDDIYLKVDAKFVTMKSVQSGSLMLSSELLIFESSTKYLEIEIDTIVSIFLRRYLLRDTSLELFTTLHRSFFFDFFEDQRDQVIRELMRVKPKNLKFVQTSQEAINRLIKKYQFLWQNGKLSNFDYLMAINSFAGRTYNDLAQYPVFPWIISDYTSDTLNLSDSAAFRDLTKPIGALTEERLGMLKERLTSGEEMEYQYLYGSFYSSAAVVIGYMVRVEPFTSLHIELQSGKFDNPDRLFNSIPKAWDSVNNLMMDFRELIPEFFFLPDFLVNSNHFDFGMKNSDVELPPWASSPLDFIQKNRMALESPVISAMLPYWIDMTFGVTSRGEKAVPIDNIFHPLFFEEVPKNYDLHSDPDIQFRTEFAACFGQAPIQIFNEQHIERFIIQRRLNIKQPCLSIECGKNRPILSIEVENDTITVVNADYKVFSDSNNEVSQLHLNSSLSEADIQLCTKLVRTRHKIALISMPWDRSFCIAHIDEGTKYIKRFHIRKISSVAISEYHYATASFDGTVAIWKNEIDKPQIPITTITKHNSPVNSIDMNDVSNMIVSGGRDGTLITTSLMNGEILKMITIAEGEPHLVKVSNSGTICVCVIQPAKSLVKVFDINLNQIGSCLFESYIRCMTIFEWYDGQEMLVIGMRNQTVKIVKIPNFSSVWSCENIDVSTVEVMRLPLMSVILGTMQGKVMKIELEDNDSIEENDDSSASLI